MGDESERKWEIDWQFEDVAVVSEVEHECLKSWGGEQWVDNQNIEDLVLGINEVSIKEKSQ